jgi:cytochrome c peroxidase
VALGGSHEIALIDRRGLHERIERAAAGERVVPSLGAFEDIPNDAGFLHGLREFVSTCGNGPGSIAAMGGTIYTANYFSGELVEIADGKAVKATVYGKPLGKTRLGKGQMYFHDATICFQQWMSCASCHPNDARVDGLNWDLLNDGPGSLKNTKSLLYSHRTPPTTITGIRANARISVRKGIEHTFFAKLDESVPRSIDRWLMSLRAVPSPLLREGKLSEAALRGKVHFERSCASCHGGKYYTDMKMYDVPWATGKDAEVPMDVPALTEVWRTAPYLYDGRSYTMREMLDVHGPTEPLTDDELNDLAEYVLSL